MAPFGSEVGVVTAFGIESLVLPAPVDAELFGALIIRPDLSRPFASTGPGIGCTAFEVRRKRR